MCYIFAREELLVHDLIGVCSEERDSTSTGARNSIVAATSITPAGVYVAQNGVYSSVDYSRSVNVSYGTHGSSPREGSLFGFHGHFCVGSMEGEAHLDEFADMRIVLAGGLETDTQL